MTERDEDQLRSFVYGNVNISNPNVTREMVDVIADKTAREDALDEIARLGQEYDANRFCCNCAHSFKNPLGKKTGFSDPEYYPTLECRRYPPVGEPIIVHDAYCCGEHKARSKPSGGEG